MASFVLQRLQARNRLQSRAVCLWTRFNKTRRVYTERIVSAAGQHVYKPKTIFRRPLDGQENIFHEYYRRNLASGATCALIKSKISLKEETVRHALSMLCQRQALLRATVIEASYGKRRFFESVSGVSEHRINFLVVDKDVDDRLAVWEQLIAEMDYERDEGCLWRAVLLREKFDKDENCFYNALALFVCHSIVDAAAMFSLLQQLLDYIEAITKGESIKITDIEEMPFFPSPATLLSHKLNQIEKHVTFSQNSKVSPGLPAGNINPVLARFPSSKSTDLSPDPVTKVMLQKIPWHMLKKLASCCRNHNCTLTGTFLAVCHIAFSSLLDTKSLPSGLSNDIACTVGMSKDFLIALPEDSIAYRGTVLPYDLPLSADDGNVWEIARLCTKTLHSDMADSRYLEFMLAFEKDDAEGILNDILEQAKLPLAMRRQSSLGLSNAFPVSSNDDPNRNFVLQDMFGVVPSHVRFATFRNFAMTINGQMNWITTYDGSLISAEIAKAFRNSIKEQLTKMINN